MAFEVGHWARYRSNSSGGGEATLTWRVDGEHEGDWFVEVESVGEGGWLVTKLLIHVGARNDAEEIQIRAALMQSGSGAPRELGGQMLDASKRMYGRFARAVVIDWADAPAEELQVAAGQFAGAHRRTHEERFGPFESAGAASKEHAGGPPKSPAHLKKTPSHPIREWIGSSGNPGGGAACSTS